jgi:hypothetical protein
MRTVTHSFYRPEAPAMRRAIVVGLLSTAVLGIIFAVNSAYSSQFVGAGLCLTASAAALGLLARQYGYLVPTAGDSVNDGAYAARRSR